MPEEIKCSNCGAALSSTDEKCPYCGTPNPKWRGPVAQIDLSKSTSEYESPKPDRTSPAALLPQQSRPAKSYLSRLLMILVVIGLSSAAYWGWRQHAVKSAIYNKQKLMAYEPLRHWRYTESKTKDSVLKIRNAEIYSDESLEHIDSLAAAMNYPSYLLLSSKILLSYRYVYLEILKSYGADSVFFISITMPETGYKPFKGYDDSCYVHFRFDNGTMEKLMIKEFKEHFSTSSVFPNYYDFSLPDSFLGRINKSRKFTLYVRPYFASDKFEYGAKQDTLTLTFQTDSLNWPETKTPKRKNVR